MKSKWRINYLLISSLVFQFAGIVLFNEQCRVSIIQHINTFYGTILDEHFRCIGLSYLSTFLLLTGIISLLYFFKLKNKLSEVYLYFISVCLLVLHYFYYLFLNAKNYPVYDDQGAILEFLLNYHNATSATEKIRLVVSPYNESMIIIPKLFVLGWMKIFGEINFRQLIIFNGYLLLLLHLFLFAKAQVNKTRLLLLFGLCIFLFQFQYYDDAFWAISGLGYYGVFIFSALAFYFLQKQNTTAILSSLTCSVIAAYTFGNGWLAFPICICFLLFEKRVREIWIWLIAFALVLISYFILRSEFHALSVANWNPLDNILFVLIFLGSAYQFFYSPIIPFIAGTFIISAFIFLAIKKEYKTSPVQFLLLTFLILSAIAAAPLRSGMEPNGLYGLHVRYGIFSILAFVLTISLLSGHTGFQKKYKIYFIASAFVYNALTGIFFYPEVVIRKEKIESIITGIKENKFDVQYSTFRKDDVEILLKESIEKGIYKP